MELMVCDSRVEHIVLFKQRRPDGPSEAVVASSVTLEQRLVYSIVTLLRCGVFQLFRGLLLLHGGLCGLLLQLLG